MYLRTVSHTKYHILCSCSSWYPDLHNKRTHFASPITKFCWTMTVDNVAQKISLLKTICSMVNFTFFALMQTETIFEINTTTNDCTIF